MKAIAINPFSWNVPRGMNRYCWRVRYKIKSHWFEGSSDFTIFLPVQANIKDAEECLNIAVDLTQVKGLLLTRRYQCVGEMGSGCGDYFDSILELEAHQRQCDGKNAQMRKIPTRKKVDNQDGSLT